LAATIAANKAKTTLRNIFFFFKNLLTMPRPLSRLGAWIAGTRLKQGPLNPKLYTNIVGKAKTRFELDDVVHDFDQHVGARPDPVFLRAAAQVATTIPDCPPIVAALLLNRIPKDSVHGSAPHTVAVATAVLAKASAAGDQAAAQIAFSHLTRPQSFAWFSLLRANDIDSTAVKGVLEDMVVKLKSEDADPPLLGVALKKSSSYRDPDLLERVWKWSFEQRQRILECVVADRGAALMYAQYIISMSRLGYLEKALLAWGEWRQSPLGSSDAVPFSDLLRTAVITAAASHGDAKTAEELYRSSPATFAIPTPGHDQESMRTSLITAYSHAGLSDMAVAQLREAEAAGPVSVIVYSTAIDACARVGDFDQAQAIIANMRAKGVFPNDITWMSLLGPCRKYRNVSVAEYAFSQILQFEDQDRQAAAFVVMGDVYRDAGLIDRAEELRQRRIASGLYKQRGAVDVHVDGKLHCFHVGEIPTELAQYTEAIEAKLDEWTRVLSLSGVSTESIMCRHSEKLALAFAVIKGQKDITLQKNLRVCFACHDASCAITSIEGITVRHKDKSRVHVMKDGFCSCGGRY
jgi:pentatricopeptide repeat protein